jgi:hypothetical protein
MEEGHISKSIPPGRLLALTAGGLVVATVVVFGAILPAEFNKDPLGIGKATGLSRLWAPAEVAFDASKAGTGTLAREYDMLWRTDTIEIPLRSGDDRTRGNELEYKVRMKKDATLIYEWEVAAVSNPEEFYYDFHGQTIPEGENEDDVMVATYKQATGTKAQGSLTAPFDGVHGWYLQNQSAGEVVVKIKIAGFYELIEPGDLGNDGGIIANVPAAEAFGPPP